MYTRPKPKVESVPLERLAFDPRCQQRGGLAGVVGDDAAIRAACWQPGTDGTLLCVADPRVAAELSGALADGAEFDPLEVVREQPKNKRSQPTLWVFGGFTRGAAYKLFGGFQSVPCNVYEGTFEDAIFWSLAENYKNAQTRGVGSARRSLETLLGSAMLMERVKQEAARAGGLAKAIAAACQVHYATVARFLKERKLTIQGARLTPRDPKDNSNASASLVACDKGQVPGRPSAPEVIRPAPVATGEPEPEEPDDEPAYTVPPDLVYTVPVVDAPAAATAPEPPPTPDGINGGLLVEVKSAITKQRATADQILRDIRSAQEGLKKLLCQQYAGLMMQRVTIAGTPQFSRRQVVVRGSIARSEWASRELASVARTVRRTRPRTACAGCQGAGCVSCKMFGFVPDDDTLLRTDAQLVFDFGDPWKDAEEAV